MSSNALIKLNIEHKIATIIINRPEVLNALSVDVIHELISAFDRLEKDSDTGVIILTGEGTKAFIAGADIKYMQKLGKEGALEFGKLGQLLTLKIENSSKPVIAAVNGFALGGGCEISLACHIRIASQNAIFGQPEVKIGLIPGWGGTQRLPRIVGKGHANHLIISAKPINADESYRIGLVNEVVPLTDLMKTTHEYATTILQNSPQAITESLKCINSSIGISTNEGLKNELNSFANLFETKETEEGLSAFIEKRKPIFRT
jgi:enoyl-CoA hydratase